MRPNRPKRRHKPTPRPGSRSRFSPSLEARCRRYAGIRCGRIPPRLSQPHLPRRLAEQLSATRSRLELVLESVSDAVVGVDRLGRLAYLNSRAARQAGRHKEDLLGQDLSSLFPGADGALVRRHLVRTVKEGLKARIEYFSKSYARWFETRIFPAAGGAVIFSADVTQRKQAELQLRETLERLRIAADVAGIGFWEWCLEDGKVYFSPEWKRQLGYNDRELPDRLEEWRDRIHPDDRQRVLGQVAAFCRSPAPNFEIEYRMRHCNGDYRWISARWLLTVHEGNASRRLAVTHVDITDKRAAEDQLRYVAGHDGLTGLPNRRLLFEFAEHMVASARRAHTRLAVLFFDLDAFKPVNDTYGHHVGDQVLREAAQRIAQSVRAEDMVGRLGGDEFVAVLANVDSTRAVTQAAIHMLRTLEPPYRVDGLELQVPASVGIAIFPDHGIGIETLIECADAAMYHAKHRPNPKLEFYSPSIHQQQQERTTVNERMKADLEARRFELVYQPIFDCRSRRMVSLEAQMRWPAMNLSPTDFVPMAESNGQIVALGEWALGEACDQLREWFSRGLPMPMMELKVSPLQFFRKDFCDDTARLLEVKGIAPRTIRIEVCEATMMRDEEEVRQVMKNLRRLGIGVTIKEFGHGYPSLEQLNRLPVQALKINTRHFSPALTETVQVMCRKLGFDLVACHVESAETLRRLRRQHYPKAQGFFLCRPLRGNELAAWYRTH